MEKALPEEGLVVFGVAADMQEVLSPAGEHDAAVVNIAGLALIQGRHVEHCNMPKIVSASKLFKGQTAEEALDAEMGLGLHGLDGADAAGGVGGADAPRDVELLAGGERIAGMIQDARDARA